MQIQQKNTQQKEQWCNKKSNQWNASEQQVKGLVFHYTFLSPILFWCQTNKQKAATKKKHKLHTHTKAGQYYYSLFQALQINIFCQVTETKKGAVNYSDIQITSGLIDPLRM